MSDRIWSARGPLITGFVTIAALFGGLGGWGALASIDSAVVANGQIQVEKNRQVVQHPDGGVVEKIAVAEGQAVQAGDLLLRLDGTEARSELGIVESQLFEMQARRARLEAERDGRDRVTFPDELLAVAQTRADVAEQVEGQRRLFAARLDTLKSQTDQLAKRQVQISSQLDGIDAQIAALKTQMGLTVSELADQQRLLDRGLAQSARVKELERSVAATQGSLGELMAQRAENDGKATETDLQALQLVATRREDASTQLRDIGSQELQLVEKRRALQDKVARLDIVAPVSGVVFGLAVTTPRAVIRPADPVMYIIPQDRPLVIAAQIPPIHIDEVHVGQEVRLVFPAFSGRTLPTFFGNISLLSADALSDQKTGASFYRAEITFAPEDTALLDGRTLMPGMPVEAFIETGSRTPLGYLLKPFTDYFSKAFREE